MNRRQLLALGGLTVAAPRTMAAPTPPAPLEQEIRIAVMDPGEYSAKIVGVDVQDDRIVVKMQITQPIEFITMRFVVPESN